MFVVLLALVIKLGGRFYGWWIQLFFTFGNKEIKYKTHHCSFWKIILFTLHFFLWLELFLTCQF